MWMSIDRFDCLYLSKLRHDIDLPINGGRTTGAFYFVNGRIVSLQATVLPANGDYGIPEMGAVRRPRLRAFFTEHAPVDEMQPNRRHRCGAATGGRSFCAFTVQDPL